MGTTKGTRSGGRRVLTTIVVAGALVTSGAACSDDGGADRSERTTTSAAPPMAVDMDFERLMSADSQFEGFRDLMAVADYTSGLDEDEEYTILAPNTDAIGAIDPETLERLRSGPSEELTAFLDRHVVSGALTTAEIAGAAATGIETVGGERLEVAVGVEDGSLRIGGALVLKRDIESASGMIHVLEAPVTAAPAAAP